jgi:hypothetical protein
VSRKKLIEYALCNNVQLTSLDALGLTPDVEKIDLKDCALLADISFIKQLPKLQYLTIENCPCLTDLAVLTEVSSLLKLRLYAMPDLEILGTLQDNTQTIHLQVVQDYRMFSGFHEKKPNLLYVYIHAASVENLKPIVSLRNVVQLRFDYCSKLSDIRDLVNCKSLNEVQFTNCEILESTAPLAQLNNLRSLRILYCPRIKYLNEVLAIKTLEEFELVRCDLIQELEFQPDNQLIDLRLQDNRQLSKLTNLHLLTKLKYLMLEQCDSFVEYDALALIENLEELNLFYLLNLRSKAFTQKLKKLNVLRIWDYKHKMNFQDGVKTIWPNNDFIPFPL